MIVELSQAEFAELRWHLLRSKLQGAEESHTRRKLGWSAEDALSIHLMRKSAIEIESFEKYAVVKWVRFTLP